MIRRSAIPLVAAVALVVMFAPSGGVSSQSPAEVVVLNLPEVQRVEGKVMLSQPVRLAELAAFRDITVPPVRRSQTTRLVDAGILETDGFPTLVLSLHGTVKGSVQKPGDIGAILLPEEETIVEAFDTLGTMHFALETRAADVNSETPYFASVQPRYTIAFPRYRIFLYNTTDKTVSVNVFAYLTN